MKFLYAIPSTYYTTCLSHDQKRETAITANIENLTSHNKRNKKMQLGS